MLVLTRKLGEEVVIGDNIRLTVVAIRGSHVRLGFTAPAEILIRRSELRCSAGRARDQQTQSIDSRAGTTYPGQSADESG
jgi:carbon storage regulator